MNIRASSLGFSERVIFSLRSLYEKYGYEFYMNALDVEGEETRVYRKKI